VIKGSVNVQTKDASQQLAATITDLLNMDAYVGIPEETAPRKGSGEISNAQLMFIHTNGSPVRNIPPRPVIEPAIEAEDHKAAIVDHLEAAARLALNGNAPEAMKHLKLAGQTAADAARDWFEDSRNNWPPNAVSTVRAKLAKKFSGKKLDEAVEAYLAGAGEMNQVLVDTAQMRKAITYVVGEKK
jgi:hypothetical protein